MKRCGVDWCGRQAADDGAGWCSQHYVDKVGKLRRLPAAREYYKRYAEDMERYERDEFWSEDRLTLPYERLETIHG